LKLEGSDVDLFLTGSRWSSRSRKEQRVCRGAYARQGRRQGAWHAWGAAKQAAGRGGRWKVACMAGSGRTGAAQYGACKGLEEQSRGHREGSRRRRSGGKRKRRRRRSRGVRVFI